MPRLPLVLLHSHQNVVVTPKGVGLFVGLSGFSGFLEKFRNTVPFAVEILVLVAT